VMVTTLLFRSPEQDPHELTGKANLLMIMRRVVLIRLTARELRHSRGVCP
jgi:hypothetical protein